jgi:hypothetical protein
VSSSPRLHVGAALLAATVWVTAAGCSDPAPDPDQERLDRVEARLGESFSGAQVTCILDLVDDDTVRAIDRTADLDPDTDVFATYSAAVASCVADPEARPDPLPTGGPDEADPGAPPDDDASNDDGSEDDDPDPEAPVTEPGA